MGKYSRLVYKEYQDQMMKKEPFDEDLINFKSHEDICKLIGNVCRGLEIINGFKFKKAEIVTPSKVYYPGDAKNSKNPVKYGIEDNRYINIQITFQLTDNEQTIERKHILKYPELIDGQYFILNSNRFFPVAQLADGEFYHKKHNQIIVLKTLFMPLSIHGENSVLKDIHNNMEFGKGLETRNLKVVIFKKEIPLFIWYFAKFGFEETFKMFDMDKSCVCLSRDDYDNLDKNNNLELDKYYYFNLVKTAVLRVDRKWFDSNKATNGLLIQTFVSIFSHTRITLDDFYSQDFWFNRLGSSFATNKNAALDKANSVILSLERLLDNTTRDILRIPKADKENIYTIMRYMVNNFYQILRIDNQDLANKRIRVAEYLIDSFTKKLSKSVVRLVNSKRVNINTLNTIFSNIPSNYIIKRIPNINLIRYSNNTSTLDLFSSILKASKNGPQAQSKQGGVSITSKSLHPSYLGRLDTISTSSGDPGTSVTLIPFFHPCDPNHVGAFFFTDKMEIETMNMHDNEEKMKEQELMELSAESMEYEED